MSANSLCPPAIREFDARVSATIDEFGETAFAAVDPIVLELARLRIAALLSNREDLTQTAIKAGLSEEKIRNLPLWPKSGLFTDSERACLEYVEQYVIDPAAMTAPQVDALSQHLTLSEIFAFAHAVYLLDGQQRTQMVFGAVLSNAASGELA